MTDPTQPNPTSQALAKNDKDALRLVAQPEYRREFADTLPSHMPVETFVRLAQGALRRDAKLLRAANNDLAAFIFAIREAARLGHEPGTDSFWLIPIGGKVEGWEGYKGVVERMYRAGAVQSVVAELVYSEDKFDWRPGDMDRPSHAPQWFKDRGQLIGAYAYAVMPGGIASKVVLVTESYIERVKAEAKSSGGSDSPWRKWPESMWLKTALLRLEPWVPTSAEYLQHQLRSAAAAVQHEPAPTVTVQVPGPGAQPAIPPGVDTTTGVIEGQVVEDIGQDAFPPTSAPADYDPREDPWAPQ